MLYALLGVAMITMLALVIDLASLRQDRRADRSMADTAVAAGAIEIDPVDPTTFARACQAAWDYLVANRPDSGGTVSAPDCVNTMPASTPCDTNTATRTTSGTIGTATVEISHPVRNGSPLMLAETQGGDRAQPVLPNVDGTACQRLGVRVVRTRTLAFAAIAGLTSGRTDVHSVGRAVLTTVANPVPGVVVLDQSACQVLTTTNEGGTLQVAGVGQPGYAVVDSDGSTCSGAYTIDAGDPSLLTALPDGANPGVIASYALGAGNGLAAYDPTDTAAGRLAPAPSALTRRVGRSFMTVRYNCTASCGPNQDHVNRLRTRLQGPGAPAGATTYGDDPILEPCTVTTNITFPAGTWHVACPAGFLVQANVDFQGGTVVFDGSVTVDIGACLSVGSGGCGGVAGGTDNVVYLRSGDLIKSDRGLLDLDRTFVHLTAGTLQFGPDFIGSARLLWSAPQTGDFEDLLAWGETTSTSQMGGQGTLVLDGTIYLPNSELVVAGRPGAGSLTGAQLVVGRLRLVGSDIFEVRPSSTRATGAIVRTVRLIR